MSRYNFGTPTFKRAILLKDLAFEICQRQGELARIGNAGVARSYEGRGFNVWYADPETSETDEYHHLDVRTGGTKVLSVAWKDGEAHQVVTFKRGAWEQYLRS